MDNHCSNIENDIKTNSILILKFDNENSKYNDFFDKITESNNNFKTVNMTDPEIIEFYEIDVLPTIFIYKEKNLLGSIEGFNTKSELLKKIKTLIE